MKLVTLQPPSFGEPCNGCGRCCREEVCKLGIAAFGDISAPCPALVEREGRTWCGIVEEADRQNIAFGAHLRWQLGVGMGCDADFGDSA